MVWDNAPSHTSKTVKSFLGKQNKDNPIVWLSNIPPYSPELNPIEMVWGYLKKKLANQFCKTTRKPKELVTKTLDEMKKDKELIKSFFRHPEMECYQFSI
jgi:transposase